MVVRAFRIGARCAVELAVGASLVVAPLAPVHAEIYRCSVDAKTVYSDQPCGTSPIVVDVAPSAPPPTSPVRVDRERTRVGHQLARARTVEARSDARVDGGRPERAAKAGERKHVTVGMRLNRTDVRERLGEPDRRSSAGGMDVWTYLPADHDYQTRTVIKFRRDGTVFDIERVVQR